MLPVMAGMIVAGIVHMMLHPPAAPGSAPGPAAPAPYGFPASLWTDWLGGVLPSADPAPPQSTRSTQRAAARDAKPPPKSSEGEGPFTALQQMFQTGADVHEQNVKAMRAIFETFWSNPAAPDASSSATPANAPDPSGQTTPPKGARR